MENSIVVSVPFEAIFIDDKNIPKEIPKEKHIKLHQPVKVIGIVQLPTKNQVGFIIEGHELGEECFPYHYWISTRFAVKQKPKRYPYELN